MNRNWFHRMLLAYTPAFFIVIFVLFLIFFKILNDQSRQEALKVNESLAGQAYLYVDKSLKEIDQRVLRESLINKSFQQFLNQKDMSNVPVNLEAYKSLQELKIAYPIIESAYLVRYNDQSVLSLSTITKVSDYGDQLFIDDYIEHHSSQWTNSRLFREFSNQNGKEVVSLTRPVPFYTKSKGFIVVNVSLESIKSGIKEMYDPEVSFVRLIDRQGKELLSEEAYNDGDEMILTQFTSDYTGWRIESGFVQSNMSRIMNSINLLWLLISGIVVFTGIGWMIYFTKKAYKPLEQLVGKIRSISNEQDQEQGPHLNEFKFINYTLDQMMEQSHLYHQERDEVLAIRKNYTFEKLLKDIGAFPDWEKEMGKLGLSKLFYPSVVFFVEIDHYNEWAEKLEEKEMVQIKANIEKDASQMKDKAVSILWCGWANEHRLVGIAQVVDEMIDPKKFLDEYKNQIAAYSFLTVTIGYSKMITIPEELRKAYREAEEALTYKAVTGADRVIQYEEITHSEVDIYSHLKIAHEIVLAYRTGSDIWHEKYWQLFEQIRKTKLRKEELVNIMNFLVYYLERERDLFPQELQKIWREYFLPRLMDQLEKFDTLGELEDNIYKLLNQLSNQMISVRQTRSYHQVLTDIKEYIEINFDKEDLSLDHLSEVFDLKGKYISKLFKEEFGEKFVDFLIRIRMERAEELLKTTDNTITEISEQVGYMNANSFTRVFRKIYGISPGEYRRKNLSSA